MKTNFNLRKIFFSLMLFLFLLHYTKSAVWGRDVKCPDVAETGRLSVLSVNILFSEFEQMGKRLRDIASFVAINDVHVLMLQEVIGGSLAAKLATDLGGTEIKTNTAQKLGNILSEEFGLDYNISVGFANGLPKVFSVFNATLSRCEIVASIVKRLPKAAELEFQDQNIKFARNVLMSRLSLPGFGNINIYNTHLCSGCSSEERLRQIEILLGFLNNVEALIPNKNPIILGGDFNTNLVNADSSEQKLYDLITADNAFIDSYAMFTDPGNPISCISENGNILLSEGCTLGVSFIGDSFGNQKPKRIDYIFGKELNVVNSIVVFNPAVIPGEQSVSDHSGIFTTFRLPR